MNDVAGISALVAQPHDRPAAKACASCARVDIGVHYAKVSPWRVFAADGFITVTDGANAGSGPAVVGYDLDRTELWRQPIAAGAAAVLVDDGLVTIHSDSDGGATVVTLYS